MDLHPFIRTLLIALVLAMIFWREAVPVILSIMAAYIVLIFVYFIIEDAIENRKKK